MPEKKDELEEEVQAEAEVEGEEKPEGGDDADEENKAAFEQERDPDEAVFAEQAIQSYVGEVLAEVEPAIADAVEAFGGWTLSQPDAEVFKDPGFFEQATTAFRDQIATVFGSADTPIGKAVLGDIGNAAGKAQAECTSADELASALSTAVRDACWYLRDNIQGVLSDQWDQIRDLAYEGSTDFIPVLHEMGLPNFDTDGTKISDAMVATGEAYREVAPEKKEEVAEKEGAEVDDATKEEAEEQQEMALEEEETNKAVA